MEFGYLQFGRLVFGDYTDRSLNRPISLSKMELRVRAAAASCAWWPTEPRPSRKWEKLYLWIRQLCQHLSHQGRASKAQVQQVAGAPLHPAVWERGRLSQRGRVHQQDRRPVGYHACGGGGGILHGLQLPMVDQHMNTCLPPCSNRINCFGLIVPARRPDGLA